MDHKYTLGQRRKDRTSPEKRLDRKLSAALNETQRRGGNTSVDKMLGKSDHRYLLSNRIASLQWLNGRTVTLDSVSFLVLDNRHGADGIELLIRSPDGPCWTRWVSIALVSF